MNILFACDNAVIGIFAGVVKNLLSIIQIAGPILCMISLVYTFILMAQNPDEKKHPKRIKNSILALIILFFIPLIVNVVMDMSAGTSEFSNCWNQSNGIKFGSAPSYIPINGSDNRTQVIGNSTYENGTARPSSSPGSGNNNNGGAIDVVPSGNSNSRVIFLGDSRTVQMYAYSTGDWNGANYSSGGVHVVGNDVYVAQGSMGLKWMQSTGIPEALKYMGSGTSLVILMGVNDLYNESNYISYINSNVSNWTSRGTKVYFCSVNPTDGKYSNMTSKINNFNNNVKNGLDSKVGWINSNGSFKFKTTDGLHYDGATYKNLYNYIKNRL